MLCKKETLMLIVHINRELCANIRYNNCSGGVILLTAVVWLTELKILKALDIIHILYIYKMSQESQWDSEEGYQVVSLKTKGKRYNTNERSE